MTGQGSFWFGSTGFYNGVINQSLRFEDGDSAYLLRTPSSAGNHKSLTISMWVKRGNITSNQVLINVFVSASPNNQGVLRFNSSDQLQFTNFSGEYDIVTNRKFRDTTNWYHILIRVDTTQSTASERIKIYINGTLETSLATSTYPNQNLDLEWNTTNKHLIGARTDNSTPTPIQRLDGYLAEVNLVDGQALGPESFGETKNGVWISKGYSSSYGTNGFRLTFADSSSLGDDTSGNGNDFTASGLASTDVVLDSPENNFCTMNSTDLQYNATLHEGNLHLKATTYSGGNYGHSICTFNIPSSGKWYIEILAKNLLGTGNATSFGVMDRNVIQPASNKASPQYVVTTGEGFDGLQHQHSTSGEYVAVKVDGATSGSNISMSTSGNTGSVSALAIDVDNGYLYVGATDGVGGTGSQIRWLDYADGSTGTSNVNPESGSSGTGGIARTFTNNDVISVETTVNGSNTNKSQVYLNAGQDSSFAGSLTAQGNTDANGIGDFYYEVPDGYLALCSSNLPDTTLSPDQDEQADDYFNTVLYTGNETDGLAITGVGFQPDWVWVKNRGNTDYHRVYDSNRGAQKSLAINATDNEVTSDGGVKSFDSDGFTVGSTSYANRNSGTYVAWNWKANGGTTSSNSDGTIASTVQVNTTAGFSIVTFTGDGNANATVGHGLGVKPACYIVKDRDSNAAGHWMFWHQGFSDVDNNLFLNLGNATNNGGFGTGDPATTTTFEPAVTTYNNVNGNDYVAYVFAEIEGYSRFGTYESNNSSDGTFVYTSFRPAWLLTKDIDRASMTWILYDNKRDTFNEMNNNLSTGTSAEPYASSGSSIDFTSNGFKFRDGSSSWNNYTTETYIYMAFAEQPFKFSNAR